MTNLIKHKGQIFVGVVFLSGIFLTIRAFYLRDFSEAMGLVGGCILMAWLFANPNLYGKSLPESIREVEKSEYLWIVVAATVLALVGIAWPELD